MSRCRWRARNSRSSGDTVGRVGAWNRPLGPPPVSYISPESIIGAGGWLHRATARQWKGPVGPPGLQSRLRSVPTRHTAIDRKSTRLNSSHSQISYAVFCLKKKKNNIQCMHTDLSRAQQVYTINTDDKLLDEKMSTGHTVY